MGIADGCMDKCLICYTQRCISASGCSPVSRHVWMDGPFRLKKNGRSGRCSRWHADAASPLQRTFHIIKVLHITCLLSHYWYDV